MKLKSIRIQKMVIKLTITILVPMNIHYICIEYLKLIYKLTYIKYI